MATETNASSRPQALVTGGARRIGAQIVSSLHLAGYDVVIHVRQSRQAGEELASGLNDQRANSAQVLVGDLADPAFAESAYQTLDSQQGLKLLVNNASSFFETPIGAVTDEHWNALFDSNLKGAFFLSQALLPMLRKANGSIVNIVDIHAERPMSGFPVYSMAKAGLSMMTRALAKELAPDIRVNGVSPGAILWPETDTTDKQKQILERIAMKRAGNPEDIAQAVLFLAEAPYVTGQILPVDGGRSLHM
ncbi:MAG: pteridine reductase [Lysobacteraceae bacterium]|nr:MAG: pteridine reductase [Xanthomonadaceae bacterium]